MICATRPRPSTLARRLVAGLLILAGLATVLPAQARESVVVFAAASTREAVLAVAAIAGDRLGLDLKASFAGSSALARQIEAGAPADLYLSANTAWMDRLEASGLIEGRSRRDLVRNRLVVIAPTDTALPSLPDPLSAEADLMAALAGRRLAMAEPDSVPAGMYAKQALIFLGLWPALTGRLAPAADVRAALALVERGETPLGIVYATDARAASGVAVVSTIPVQAHRPIVYPIALTTGGAQRQPARALMELFLSQDGAAAFAARGFEPIKP